MAENHQCPACGRDATEQRLNDLYVVNRVTGWAQEQLKILMAEIMMKEGKFSWSPYGEILKELQRIIGKMITVSAIENTREAKEKE